MIGMPPCNNLTTSFIDGFNRIHLSNYPGWSRVYTRVIKTGDVRVGDPVSII